MVIPCYGREDTGKSFFLNSASPKIRYISYLGACDIWDIYAAFFHPGFIKKFSSLLVWKGRRDEALLFIPNSLPTLSNISFWHSVLLTIWGGGVFLFRFVFALNILSICKEWKHISLESYQYPLLLFPNKSWHPPSRTHSMDAPDQFSLDEI